ncbi:MAG: hypothetical protein HY703_11225 [Gemmatimonadetes bacterium]|nr:hypothetical protein [Gemmatimonadota bacterium]
MTDLSSALRRTFELLKQTEPLPDEHDVVWQGPYYIPRPGKWYPSHFVLYSGTLYASLSIPPVRHDLSWRIGSDVVTFEQGFSMGNYRLGETEWAEALAQIERRLRSAVKGFATYNRRVERLLPPTCRTGRIQRHLTWPTGWKPPLPPRDINRFEEGIERAKGLPPLDEMTLSAYLDAVAVAYDSVFEDLRPLLPLEKYKRRADGRHGGLLDLPPRDAAAFARWFHDGKWAGTHPWEIVFGHPHGIMIAPRYQTDTRLWLYALWVDSETWYAAAAHMGIALAEAEIPFEFHDWKKVSAALQGVDKVEVGPDLYAVTYEELEQERPDALGSIRWDPIPRMGPITPHQTSRVRAAESEN